MSTDNEHDDWTQEDYEDDALGDLAFADEAELERFEEFVRRAVLAGALQHKDGAP